MRIITSYTKQHRQVRQIISKYWPLLLADPIASKYVEKQPLYPLAPFHAGGVTIVSLR